MQDREGRELRRRVARLKRDRPGFRFSAALRAEITAWVAKHRERGQWWRELSSAIGVPEQTLKRWAEPRPMAPASLVAVEVIDAPPPGTVTLVSPTGLRIEGVAIADAIAILRGLA
jgi:hypothetical protein